MELIEALYTEFHTELVDWCSYMAGERAKAEDFVQEAFIRALGYSDLLETLAAEQRRSWLYRTVKNLFLDERRRLSRETVTDKVPEAGPALSPADSRMPELEALEWTELIGELPEPERLIFTMRYLQGYNSSEIGGLLKMPPGTVRSKLSDARRHLRNALGGCNNG